MSFDYADRVHQMDKETVGCALPNFLSSPIFNRLYVENIDAAVPGAVDSLLQRTSKYIKGVLSTLFEREFKEFPQLVATTKAELRDLVQEQLDKLIGMTEETIESLRWVHTFKEKAYMQLIKKVEDELADECDPKPLETNETDDDKPPPMEQVDIDGEVALIAHGISAEELSELKNMKGGFSHRVKMTQVTLKAYTHLMYQHMLESVCRMCRLVLVEQMHKKLEHFFYMKDDDYINAKVRQDPKLASRRANLEASIARLRTCDEKIGRLFA
eukprot:GHVU01225535.1.p1 GENE.GHVU01225535.1~~GHVU01225535.1.p1  ORF type:complete len:271 (+),score=61.09 GHVU01225535.1:2142-2954(+)